MSRAMRALWTVVLVGWATAAAAQTADEVIEKSVAALGGRAAHEQIKTRKASGTITLGTPMGELPGTIEIVNQAPNRTRTLIKADLTSLGAGPVEIDQRFDGQNGFVGNSLQGDTDMTGNQLDNMRNTSFPHPFLTYKAQGISATLKGKERLGDGEAYVILFEPAAGSPIRQYIDAESMLPVKFVMTVNIPQAGGDVEQTTELSDYREVDGIKVPFRVSSSSAVQSYTVELRSVEHNVPVDAALFVKP